jgi:hypothetical protein
MADFSREIMFKKEITLLQTIGNISRQWNANITHQQRNKLMFL